ncbi:box C/D snoRNA protein 1-like [Haliotis cracherodii]|uniref:box C/D snoRNA protein 1-like n=1 Tax=Haliotis cracherodii TaxID=6455 RepID=UPI0039EB60E9
MDLDAQDTDKTTSVGVKDVNMDHVDEIADEPATVDENTTLNHVDQDTNKPTSEIVEPPHLEIRSTVQCQVCGDNPAKYRCPGCDQRTCSLPCVNKHKVVTGCDGRRNKTAHVAMKGFTDTHLLSDYRFLEDGSRRNHSCQRDFLKIKHDKPKALMKLIRHAESLGIELRTMPYPMSKRKNNRTIFLYRTKEILWQIEWKFPHADASFMDKKQNQSLTLETLLNKYLHQNEADPLVLHQLRQYVEVGVAGCCLLMKAEGRPANDVRYHELDLSKSVLENLRGKCVVEYPTINVVLRTCSQNYNLLSKEEEDKLWQDRRRGNFSRQRDFTPHQQKPQHKGGNSTLGQRDLNVTNNVAMVSDEGSNVNAL